MSGYGFSVGSSGYDDEDRLVNWQRSDTNLDQSWNLSAVGNWSSITENSSTQNRTHGPTHEMLTVASQSVTHDAKGNTTLIPAVLRPTNSGLPPTASRLSWDFENKLIAADTDNDSMDDIFYKFDALGRRVGRDDGTANVVYFQDGQQTIADYPSGTAAGSPTYTCVYASYIDEPVMRGGSGGLRYYHRNQQYSITTVSDGGGSVVERYAYSAYGQVTIFDDSGSQISNSEILNRYTHTGREWDEGLSLYHYRARMYDAVGGRFVSRDPIGFDGSKSSLYEYTSSRTLTSVDPAGESPVVVGGAVIIACLVTASCPIKHALWDRANSAVDPTGAQSTCVDKLYRSMPNASRCLLNYKISTNGPITLCNPFCRAAYGQAASRVYLSPTTASCSDCKSSVDGLLTLMHECVHVKEHCTDGGTDCGETQAYGKSTNDLFRNRYSVCMRLKTQGLCSSVRDCLSHIQSILINEEIEFKMYHKRCHGTEPDLPWRR